MMQHSDSDHSDSKDLLSQRISEVLKRWAESGSFSEELCHKFRDALAEELEKQGNNIREGAATDSADEVVTIAHRRDVTPNNVLHVRCPHCHTPTEVAVDTSLSDLNCSSCGSRFSLVGDQNETRHAPTVTRVGQFELIERIGVGGFGTVWKARDVQLDRTVAIKIPRQGDMNAAETEKFLREARAAAQLKHPNIVAVHEVGRDGDTVYIVCDLVRGLTLDDWLTGQQPSPREAAELCITLADALEHAHRQGVIHRDLKPGNIMIDGEGEVHLMDFGLARREAGEVTMTLEGQVLGTPAYMSPEQAEGMSHEADRRSDVYSLGVILFRLLTGELPFRGNARMIMHQVIHDDPPSLRRFNATIPKDMETIALKCLEKTPAKRYGTAAEVGQELQRYLHGEPIEARPVGRLERSWRWARRKPVHAALVILLVVTAVGGVVVAFTQAQLRQEAEAAQQEAQQQQQIAEAVNDFYTEEVFQLANPDYSIQPNITLKQALRTAGKHVGDRFPDSPSLEVAVRDELGNMLRAVDEPRLAIDQLEKAVEIHQDLHGAKDPRTLRTKSRLAAALLGGKRHAEARRLFESVIQDQKEVLGESNEETIRTTMLYGVVLRESHDPEYWALSKRNYEHAVSALGPKHPVTLETQSDLAWSLRWRGQLQEALPHAKAASAGLQEVLGETHPNSMFALYNYAACLQRLGRKEEAMEVLEHLLQLRLENLGAAHRETLWTAARLASIYWTLGDQEKAEKTLDKASAGIDQILASGKQSNSDAILWIAETYDRAGRYEEARRIVQHVAKSRPDELVVMGVSTEEASLYLSTIMLKMGDSEKARELVQDVLAQQAANEENLSEFVDRMVCRSRFGRPVGEMLVQLDSSELDAKPEILSSEITDNLSWAALNQLAWSIASSPDQKPAEYAKALSLAMIAIEKSPQNASVLNTLGVCHYRVGNWAEAIDALQQARTFNGDRLEDLAFLALAHHRNGDSQYAEEVAEDLRELIDNDEIRVQEVEQKRILNEFNEVL